MTITERKKRLRVWFPNYPLAIWIEQIEIVGNTMRFEVPDKKDILRFQLHFVYSEVLEIEGLEYNNFYANYTGDCWLTKITKKEGL